MHIQSSTQGVTIVSHRGEGEKEYMCVSKISPTIHKVLITLMSCLSVFWTIHPIISQGRMFPSRVNSITDLLNRMKPVPFWPLALLATVSALEWKPYTSAGARKAVLTSTTEAIVEVPVFYTAGEGSGPKLRLRVRKYDGSGGSPIRLVHLFVGGPAQDGTLWEFMLPTLQALFGQSKTAFILTDHRGVGADSSVTTGPEDMSWATGDFQAWAASRPYPLKAINTSDAGRDAVLVARLLAAEYPKAEHILVGSSYGTRVAIAAANEAPDQFGAILLDSLDMENAASGLGAVDGNELLENCQNNAYCKRMTGGDPMKLAQVIPQVVTNMAANPCRQELSRLLEELVPGMSPCAGIEAIFYKIMTMGGATATNRVMPAMLLVPLLQQLDTCERPEVASKIMEKFRSLLVGLFTSLSVSGREEGGLFSAMNVLRFGQPSDLGRDNHISDEPVKVPEPMISCAGSSLPVHAFVHYYISASERWRGLPPSYCGRGCPQALFKVCQAYNNYAQYRELFGAHAYQPDGLSQRTLNTGRARVLVLSGGLDFNTPAKAISAMFSLIGAPHKRLLMLRNRGHELLSQSGCIRAAVAEMLGEGGAGAVETCAKKQNAVTMDWEGVDGNGKGGRYGIIIRGLFREDPTPAEIAANRAIPDDGSSSVSTTTWVIISVAGIAVVAGGLATFPFLRKPLQPVTTK